ncbi:MAG: hypothetical protein ABFS08_06925 [Pseudomonadota bacterium]
MSKRLPPTDNDASLVGEHYAVIYTPRKTRNRFPENCVTLYGNELEATDAADEDKGLRAARVVGPSRSSEGVMLYYLAHWLS